MENKDRIIFAADVGSLPELQEYLAKLNGKIGAIKLGMELLTHALLTGEPVFQTVLRESALQIMLDLKYGDTPDTVAKASMEVSKYGKGRILGFTVHCSAGREALKQAVKAVKDNFLPEFGIPPMVIAVSLLTSLDENDLKETELGIQGTPEEVVLRWSRIAAEEGVPAIVCSPKETKKVLEMNPNFKVINPGIRFINSDPKSQKRFTTAEEAIRNGAEYVVIGSDLRKGDPVANAYRFALEIESGLKGRQV